MTNGDGRGRRPTLAHRAEFALFRGLRAVVLLVPERLAVMVAAVLGAVAGSVLRIRRADVDRHLEWAFPDWDRRRRDRVARASYRHLAREAVMLFRIGGWSSDRVRERTEMPDLDAVRAAVEDRGGALLLTGHLGNWEMEGAAVAARGVPIDVVAKGMANPDFERELFGTRERLGMRVVAMGGAPRHVLRSLRRGRVVAIVGDQNQHRNGVFVPFFGRRAASARGPGTFALHTGAPVFVGFAVRLPGWRQRYRVRLEPLAFERTGDFHRDLEAFTAAYMAAVEDAARAYPEQYFWQHKRWKTRPPEEPVAADPVQHDEH